MPRLPATTRTWPKEPLWLSGAGGGSAGSVVMTSGGAGGMVGPGSGAGRNGRHRGRYSRGAHRCPGAAAANLRVGGGVVRMPVAGPAVTPGRLVPGGVTVAQEIL